MIEIKIALNETEIKNSDILTKTATYLLSLAGHQTAMVNEESKPKKRVSRNLGDEPGVEKIVISGPDFIEIKIPPHSHNPKKPEPMEAEIKIQAPPIVENITPEKSQEVDPNLDYTDFMNFLLEHTRSKKLDKDKVNAAIRKHGGETLRDLPEKPDLIMPVYNDLLKILEGKK